MKPLVTVALACLLFSGVSGLSQPDSDYIKDHQRTGTFRHPTKPTDCQINGWKTMDWRTAIRYAGAAAVGAGTAIAGAPLVAGALGFTGAGIAAGSVASWVMSTAAVANGGGVAAGTVVAILQSVGAAGVSGAGAAVVGAVGAAVGAVAGDVQSDC